MLGDHLARLDVDQRSHAGAAPFDQAAAQRQLEHAPGTQFAVELHFGTGPGGAPGADLGNPAEHHHLLRRQLRLRGPLRSEDRSGRFPRRGQGVHHGPVEVRSSVSFG